MPLKFTKKNTSTSHTSPAIYNVTAVWSSGFQQRTGEARRSRVEFKIGEHVAATTYDLEDHPRTDLDMWIGSPPMKISHFHGHLEGEGMQIYGHFEGISTINTRWYQIELCKYHIATEQFKFRNYTLDIQTPKLRRYLDPKNIPKTSSQEVLRDSNLPNQSWLGNDRPNVVFHGFQWLDVSAFLIPSQKKIGSI